MQLQLNTLRVYQQRFWNEHDLITCIITKLVRPQSVLLEFDNIIFSQANFLSFPFVSFSVYCCTLFCNHLNNITKRISFSIPLLLFFYNCCFTARVCYEPQNKLWVSGNRQLNPGMPAVDSFRFTILHGRIGARCSSTRDAQISPLSSLLPPGILKFKLHNNALISLILPARISFARRDIQSNATRRYKILFQGRDILNYTWIFQTKCQNYDRNGPPLRKPSIFFFVLYCTFTTRFLIFELVLTFGTTIFF